MFLGCNTISLALCILAAGVYAHHSTKPGCRKNAKFVPIGTKVGSCECINDTTVNTTQHEEYKWKCMLGYEQSMCLKGDNLIDGDFKWDIFHRYPKQCQCTSSMYGAKYIVCPEKGCLDGNGTFYQPGASMRKNIKRCVCAAGTDKHLLDDYVSLYHWHCQISDAQCSGGRVLGETWKEKGQDCKCVETGPAKATIKCNRFTGCRKNAKFVPIGTKVGSCECIKDTSVNTTQHEEYKWKCMLGYEQSMCLEGDNLIVGNFKWDIFHRYPKQCQCTSSMYGAKYIACLEKGCLDGNKKFYPPGSKNIQRCVCAEGTNPHILDDYFSLYHWHCSGR